MDTGVKTLLADSRAKDVIAKQARSVVAFLTLGEAEGLAPAERPLTALANKTLHFLEKSLELEPTRCPLRSDQPEYTTRPPSTGRARSSAG